MEKRCPYCGQLMESLFKPLDKPEPELNIDRAQLAKLGESQKDAKKESDTRLHLMMNNLLDIHYT